MAFELFRGITAEAVAAESAESGYEGADFISGEITGENTIETPPVKFSNTEEDEYEWIVRSTPSGFGLQIHFDEWSSEELSGAVYTSDIEDREPEENAQTWHGRLARELESLPVSKREEFAIEWSAPDLTTPVDSFDINEHDAEANASLPVSEEVEFAAEWSAPDLTPQVDRSDVEEREAEENASSSVSEFADEVGELTLASRPTDFFESAFEHEESAAPSRTEETLDDVGPSPQELERLSIQHPVIHLLKDPPEIWDQVPEQPAEFHPAVTFLSRVAANNQKLMLMTLGVMLLCGICTFGILKLWQADRGNAVVAQSPPEHRIEVPTSTVATTAPTETGSTAQKSVASSVDSSDRSSAASPDSSSRDAENKNTRQPADSDGNPKTSTESTTNTASAAKNSGKGNALAATANAGNNAKSTPPSDARSASRKATPKSAPTVARNTTTSRNPAATSRGTTTSPKDSPATSRNTATASSSPSPSRSTTTSSNSSPSTARKPDPAPVINYGDGETRPRLVTQRISATKEDQPKRADESRRSPGHP